MAKGSTTSKQDDSMARDRSPSQDKPEPVVVAPAGEVKVKNKYFIADQGINHYHAALVMLCDEQKTIPEWKAWLAEQLKATPK